MRLDTFRELCLGLPFATEDLPFGPDTLVFRVAGKIFALLSLDDVAPSANLKCDPEQALEWRERYDGVVPGYHMNKRHWNTVSLSSDVPDADLRQMVADAYALVVAALPKRQRDVLATPASRFEAGRES